MVAIPGTRALVSGAVGAVVLNLLHEGARRVVPHAPQVHVLGMRAVSKGARAAGERPPDRRGRYRLALAGDLLSNASFYALVGKTGPQHAVLGGALLGLAAGLGAVLLPEPLGLGRQPGSRFPLTPLLTVAWYTAGGLAAGATYRALNPDGSGGD